MGEVAVRRMTVAEFFDWEPGDGRRYELVDGVPVMTGGVRDVAVDAFRGHRARVLGERCGRFASDTAVLYPSTCDLAMFGKLDDYKSVGSLNHIVLVNPDQPQAIHWWRGEDRNWVHRAHEGLDAVIEFTDLQISIGLAGFYAGLEFGQAG